MSDFHTTHAPQDPTNDDERGGIAPRPCAIVRRHGPVLMGLFLVSLACLVLYGGRGLFLLGLSTPLPLDFSLRWAEQQDVKAGINPYDVSDRLFRLKHGWPVAEQTPWHSTPTGKTSIGSGYPPWAFLWANLFIPPLPANLSRWWFFAANLLALGLLARFAWSAIPGGSWFQRSFACAAVLSANAVGTTLGNGQWGLILLALLCLGATARRIPAALCVSMAFLKPTFSLTFINGFLARRQWAPIIMTGLLTLGAACLVAWHLDSQPIAMVGQMLEQSARWNDYSYGIPDALTAIGLPRTPVIFGCLIVAVLLAWSMAARRPGDPLFALAVAGMLGRLLFYHQLYDNVLILFCLLFLIRDYFAAKHPIHLTCIAALLLTLWLPGRWTHRFDVQFAQILIWSLALAWMTRCRSKPFEVNEL